MKICLLTANYPPEACGGTEQVVTALARAFRAAGHDVAAISGSDVPRARAPADVVDEVHDGVPVARVCKRPDEQDRHGFVRPRLLGIVRERLEALRPDVVHVHSFAGLGLGLTGLCRELGVPVVVTFHDLWVTCARFFRIPAGGVRCPDGADRAPCVICVNDALQTDPAAVEQALAERDRLLREELAAATACTAPSRTAAAFVQRCVPFDRGIEVIPHGLLNPVPVDHRAAAPAAGEQLRVGTFGGLVPEKGIRELVEACRAQPCELHLHGPFHDEAFAQEIRTLVRDEALQHREHGRYGPGDAHPARYLHLAVFPSKCQETYGLVVDEALAHGVPVICSDSGALAERSMTPGVVVTPLAQLSKVLKDLLASPERLAALRSAIPADLPTIAHSARRHLDLYRSLA